MADLQHSGQSAGRWLRFGPFELDTRAGELRKRGTTLRLQGQPLRVLEILLRRSGDVVTRDELRALLWNSDTFVDFEHSLHNAIARLRDTLGDSATAPRFIQTLPRRGYRFLMAVDEVSEHVPVGRGSAAISGVLPIRSLAVLPLANLSGDPSQSYFADGMTEALITSLAQIGKLRVISRTSMMQYQGTRKSLPRIARELNVDAVLEGSVLRSDDRVRITAQLIQAPTDRHLWAESYERDLRDILGVQNEIAREVANQIRIMLTPEEHARLKMLRQVDPQAHELLLKGRYYRNKRSEESVRKGLTYFESAIKNDPGWADGYVGVADCYNILGYYNSIAPKEAYSRSQSAAQKALDLDPTLAESYTALAVVKRDYEWDWAGAEALFQRGIDLNPGYADAYHWRGTLFGMQRRYTEAIREKEKALSMDPLSVIFRTDVGRVHYFQCHYDEAIQNYQAAIEIDPHFFFVYLLLAQACLQKGMFKPAFTALKTANELTGDSAFAQARLAQGFAFATKRDKAQDLLQRLQARSGRDYVSAYDLALVHVGLGERDEALSLLEHALEQRSIWMGYLDVEPQLDAVRNDTRFEHLRNSVGLFNQ